MKLDVNTLNAKMRDGSPKGKPYRVDTNVALDVRMYSIGTNTRCNKRNVNGYSNEAKFSTSMSLTCVIEEAAKVSRATLRGIVSGYTHRGRQIPPVKATPKTYIKVILNYPLDNTYRFMVPPEPSRKPMEDGSVYLEAGDLVYAICQAYRYVYKYPSRFGVWGHCLSDLVIEGIKIDEKKRSGKRWFGIVDNYITIYPVIGS